MSVVAVTYGAECVVCEWTATGAAADRQAEKHTKTTSHATLSWAEPTKEKKA